MVVPGLAGRRRIEGGTELGGVAVHAHHVAEQGCRGGRGAGPDTQEEEGGGGQHMPSIGGSMRHFRVSGASNGMTGHAGEEDTIMRTTMWLMLGLVLAL